MYIARKRLKIDGKYREIGQPVPEALTWRTVESYVRSGHLDWVEDKPKAAKKAVPTPAKIEEPKAAEPEFIPEKVERPEEEPKVEESKEDLKPEAKETPSAE